MNPAPTYEFQAVRLEVVRQSVNPIYADISTIYLAQVKRLQIMPGKPLLPLAVNSVKQPLQSLTNGMGAIALEDALRPHL